MAFRKKADYILTEKPDIVVVPECENPEKLKFGKNTPEPTDIFWYGDNIHKGLAVISYSDLRISSLSIYNKDFRYVIPLSIKSQKIQFILLAVWCQKPERHDNYGIHTWNAINYYTDLLKEEKLIIAGDFNSSAIWDKQNREANHSNIVKFLAQRGISSTYHTIMNQEQGKEKDPTLFLHRKIDRPYHIDYCFASNVLMKKLIGVKIGKYEEWTKYSDHVPVIITFGNK